MSMSKDLAKAIQYHQTGHLQEAEVIYREILELDPNHSDALHLCGFIAHQRGNNDLAVKLIRRAIQIHPDSAFYYNNLSLALLESGRIEEAVSCCQMGLKLDPGMAETHCNLGNALKAQGKLTEAISCYQKAAKINPCSAETFNLMGSALLELCKPDEAIACYRKAIHYSPNQPEFLVNMGRACCKVQDFDEAILWFRKALAARPDYAEAYNDIAFALKASGRLDEAIAHSQKAIKIRPDYARALCNMGVMLKDKGRLEDSIAAYQKAIAINPQYAEAYHNMGIALKTLGQFKEAVSCLEKALTLKPDLAGAYYVMADILQDEGKMIAAESCYLKGLSLNPGNAAVHLNLGAVYHKLNKVEKAIVCYKKAIEIDPESAAYYSNCGSAYQQLGKIKEAIVCYKKAIEIDPEFAMPYSKCGSAYINLVNFEKAAWWFKKALELEPTDSTIHSDFLFYQHYDPEIDARQLLAEAENWQQRHGNIQNVSFTPFQTDHLDDRIRIGYVSPDFRQHSVSMFLLPLFSEHDHERFEIFCYSNVRCYDRISRRIEDLSDHWCSISGLDDRKTATKIHRDDVHILVDLAGHSGDNRLPVFAFKAAPIQVNWLGFPGTTGMRAMDYRITDAVADPEGEADEGHTETLVRLSDGFLCYSPPEDVPDISAPPFGKTGAITFGSFNNLPKISERVVEAWSRILRRVPGTSLLMKSKALRDKSVKERYIGLFEANGISADRVVMLSHLPSITEHLNLYSRIDIALDTFPYNGTTTTCEALWMGVPVISLNGNRHAARVGASILKHIGLPDLIAETEDEYVSRAVQLSHDRDLLTNLRETIRGRMKRSPICDAASFARKMENAYMEMYEDWRRGKTKSSADIAL